MEANSRTIQSSLGSCLMTLHPKSPAARLHWNKSSYSRYTKTLRHGYLPTQNLGHLVMDRDLFDVAAPVSIIYTSCVSSMAIMSVHMSQPLNDK